MDTGVVSWEEIVAGVQRKDDEVKPGQWKEIDLTDG